MSKNLSCRRHPHASLRIIASFLIPAFILTGCQKEIHQKITIPSGDETAKSGPVPPYIFNWETATYMPSPSPGNQVPMPWNSGTTAIDPNLVGDYKSADGWVLVYNTFSPTTALNDPSHTYFFTLYNKFRGLLRFYLWQQASAIATSYVTHGLSLYGTQTSTMLNFNAAEMTDLSTPQTAFSQVLTQQMNSSGGTWFVFQYEMAYDPNIVNTSFPTTGITWSSQWASISTISVYGTQTGSITGYISDPATGGFNFGSVLIKGASTLFGALTGSSFLNLTKADDALTNAGGDIVKGFLNGVLSGSSVTNHPVNLTLNTNIRLDGSLVTNGGLENMKLVLPGQSNSQTADGNTPGYNSPLGIFTLVNKPIIHLQSSTYYSTGPWEDPQSGSTYYCNYSESGFALDNNSYSIVWNPGIINSSPAGATIQNLKKQIVLLSEYTEPNYPDYYRDAFFAESVPQYQTDGGPFGDPNAYVPVGYGTWETIGKYSAAVSLNATTPLLVDFGDAFSQSLIYGLRISFDVVPNSGGPKKATIVKTFPVQVIL